MRYSRMAPPNISDREFAELQAELRELRKLKNNVATRGAAKSKIRVFLAKLWVGPELSKSLESWMTVKDSGDTDKTTSATANLLAAIFRRIMRVGFIFIFFASIPIFLIIWQNIIMERQNRSLIRQIEAQRNASSNQQVTEYLRLLLSSDQKEVTAAEGFLVSDLVNRDLAVERLGALIKSGNSDVQCSALQALSRVVASASELTLKAALLPDNPDRAVAGDLQCPATDFTGVDFGPITFVDVGFSHSIFNSADLSEVEFQTSNLRHGDFTESYLCRGETDCARFLEDTDLSYSKLTFTNRNKDVFKSGLILRGAQMKFGHVVVEEAENKNIFGRTKQIKSTTAVVPKLSRDNMITGGVCYEASFSQCYLYHVAKDKNETGLQAIDTQKLNSLRQNNCPVNLDGPIVLTALTSCEKLGLQTRW